jgi:hypothetical protein
MGLGITIQVNGSADPQLAEANRVEVSERFGDTTLFTISYPEDITNGDMALIKDSRLDPGSILTILAGKDDNPDCLVKGPVYSQQIHLEHGGEGSTVEVMGADTSIIMDREIQSVIWTDVTDSDVVSSIVGDYGLDDDVATTDTKHVEDKHSLVQRESDLSFVKKLARRNGCYFWISCDADGNETAHFQKPALDGDPSFDLVINFEKPTIQTLDIHWDVERPSSVEGLQLDLTNKENLDGAVAVTPQTILGAKKLQDIASDTRSMHVSAPSDDAGDMQARSSGALSEADWFIQASCSTTFRLLGQLVHAGMLLNVKGAGSRHSGKYFVTSVKHSIDAADHRMEIGMVRNGWGTDSTNGSVAGMF